MDNRGQLLLLSGLLVAMGVALISLYLTTASISGYRVSYSPWDLPYYEMRMALYESTRAVKLYGDVDEISEFNKNLSKIYAKHGYFLVVSVNKTTGNLYKLNLTFKTDRIELEVNKSVTT